MTGQRHGPVTPGDFLIGPPSRPGDTFHRTVVLLCSHDASGSMGLVINCPTSLTLDHLLEKSLPSHVVCYGGPVAQNYMLCLHRCGEYIRESEPVVDGISLCGDVDDIMEVAEYDSITSEQIRFFVGYSGWAPGQLEGELERDYWIVTRGSAELVFEHDPCELWSSLLRRMGGEYAILANFPHDPRLN